jgi:F-type H+-transporting ATPase subunit epsilon
MNLNIITPAATLFKGECKLVQMPGTDGLFEVLDNHAPIVALLGKGKIKVQETDGKNLFFDVESGVLKVNNNQAEILVSEV